MRNDATGTAWNRLGIGFLLMALGLGLATAGLAGDFFQHEIEKLSADLESVYAPVHLMIFGGIGLFGLGFLLGFRAFRTVTRTPTGARPLP